MNPPSTDRSWRIAFCGASGTGKTTLASELDKRMGLPLNPVGAMSVVQELGFNTPYETDRAMLTTYDKCLKEGMSYREAAAHSFGTLNDDREFAVRIRLQRKLMDRKLDWERSHSAFVTDRTTIDVLSYATMHPGTTEAPRNSLTRMEREGLPHMRRYTHIFFCPLSAFHSTEGAQKRQDDPDYHKRYEDILLRYIMKINKDWGVPMPVPLNMSDLNSRLEIIRASLQITP